MPGPTTIDAATCGRRVPLSVATKYSGFSASTLKRRLDDGTLTKYQFGPRLLVSLDEIDEVMSTPVDDVLDTYVKRVVDSAPKLTADQRSRLRALLTGPAGGDRVAS